MILIIKKNNQKKVCTLSLMLVVKILLSKMNKTKKKLKKAKESKLVYKKIFG